MEYARPLVSLLRDAEGYNEAIDDYNGNLDAARAVFEGLESGASLTELPDFRLLLTAHSGQVPHIDVGKVQKGLIQGRMEEDKSNLVLVDAVGGICPVEKRLEELYGVNKGIKRFLPRRKNVEHNAEVDHMMDLIGNNLYIEGLRTRGGIWAPDNPLAGTIYGAAAGAGLTQITSASEGLHLFVPIFFGIVGGLGAMGLSFRYSSPEFSLDKVRYLDSKIEELF